MAELKIADTSAQDIRIDSKPAQTRRIAIGGAVTVVVLVLLAFTTPAFLRWSEAEASVSRERLRTAVVTRGDFVRDLSVQGRVVAAVSPTLYASQTGTITFLVEAGDSVASGDVLATVDSPEITNQLEQQRANLARLEIEVERQRIQGKQQKLQNQKTVDLTDVALVAADREARRADQAYEKEAISQLDYEKAQDERMSAELARKHAVANAELDTERLDFELRTRQLELEGQSLLVKDLARQVAELSIRSPVSGIVGNLIVDQKAAVVRNQPALAVVDLTRFEVEAQVPESYADDLAVGMSAEVRAGAAAHVATLIAVSPEIIDNQVTVRLRFADQRPEGLRQNQRLTTRILLEAKTDVLTATRGQFLESGSGRIAYVIDGDVARKRSIEVGARSLNTVEIISGLSAGEEIIVSGTDVFNSVQTVLINN